MAKPLSSAHELGRAIGYKIDVQSLLEKLSSASPEQWNDPAHHRALLGQIGRAVQVQGTGSASKKMWVVLKVERGVPVMIDAYRDKRSALKRERFLNQHLRPERDEVKLIELKV